ncbi:MAG: hypothetical protein QXI84_08125 [Thermofilaceae archaeon]
MIGETLLLFNPLKRLSYFVEVLDLRFEGRTVVTGRLLWTNDPQVPSGDKVLTMLSEKWYRVDAKLLKALAPRYAVRVYAPVFDFQLSDLERVVFASVRAGNLYLNIGLADVRLTERGVVEVKHLFSDEVDLERFLAGESVFFELARTSQAVLEAELMKYAERFSEVLKGAAEISASIVDRVPGSFEIIASVLRKYNVEPRDVVDFAVAEAVARRQLAAGGAAAGAAAGGGGGGGGGGG